MTMLRKLLLSLLVVGSLFSAACSAEGGVSDGEGDDGVEIKGDIDEKEE